MSGSTHTKDDVGTVGVRRSARRRKQPDRFFDELVADPEYGRCYYNGDEDTTLSDVECNLSDVEILSDTDDATTFTWNYLRAPSDDEFIENDTCDSNDDDDAYEDVDEESCDDNYDSECSVNSDRVDVCDVDDLKSALDILPVPRKRPQKRPREDTSDFNTNALKKYKSTDIVLSQNVIDSVKKYLMSLGCSTLLEDVLLCVQRTILDMSNASNTNKVKYQPMYHFIEECALYEITARDPATSTLYTSTFKDRSAKFKKAVASLGIVNTIHRDILKTALCILQVRTQIIYSRLKIILVELSRTPARRKLISEVFDMFIRPHAFKESKKFTVMSNLIGFDVDNSASSDITSRAKVMNEAIQ